MFRHHNPDKILLLVPVHIIRNFYSNFMANSFTYQDQTFHTGDSVKLYLNVTEGDKSRTQLFEGLIISIKGEQSGKSITVRKIATGAIGVERIIHLGNPNLKKIELKSQGNVRRAKLYYLRSRIGKKAQKVKLKSPVSNNKSKPAGELKKPRVKRRTASQKTAAK